ncbi:S8 family serine peptidase, partial [Thermaerobacillus caldiproteolyticus]|uniref:S8 family serine peptidase n=1 Tax=Thermaerobacillus caldiproteolyticus TaxID=247480 RepID=UPI0018F17FE2
MFKKIVIVLLSVVLATTIPLNQQNYVIKAEEREQPISNSSSKSTLSSANRGNEPIFQVGKLTSKSSALPSEIILNYLDKHKEQYQFTGDAKENFKIIKQFKDKIKGNQVVRLQQVYKGIPVFGSSQVAHVDQSGVLRALSGTVVPSLDQQVHLSGERKITSERAIEIAENDLPSQKRQYVKTPTAKLNIYIKNQHAYVAYVVELNYLGEEPGRWFYFVDAYSGKIIHKFNNLQSEHVQGTGKGVLGDSKTLNMDLEEGVYSLIDQTRGSRIATYDAHYTEDLPGEIWSSKDNQLDDRYEAPAVDAHYYIGITYDYYQNVYHRNGLDDLGGDINSTVHYSEDYNNAFWNGEQMVFGDGDGQMFLPLSGGLDVVAHELTHGITEQTAGLIYEGEPGAINEAISDIFGTLVEFYNNKNPDWLIGEDIYTPGKNGDALRSLEDPTIYGDPDHYSKRYRGDEDNGGVHINSGIINKAAYLISEGGTHYGVQVTGIGKEKLGAIFYRALTQYLTPLSSFYQMRVAAIQAAQDLYGNGPEVETVKKAFQAVGIEGPNNIKDLPVDGSVTDTFEMEGQSKWFKIQPTASVISSKSHLAFKISGIDATITVYPSLEYAEKGVTYPPYDGQSGEVEFPIAWEGPYYVRVVANKPGDFVITNTSIYKEPVEHQDPSCLAELAAKEQTSLVKQLPVLRNIRDQLLRQSKEGKEFISLYYTVSNETVSDFLFDKQFRRALINDVTKLGTLVAELGKVANNQFSSYRISSEDYATLVHLKKLIEDQVSDDVKKRINGYWDQLGLDHTQNISINELLNRLGISVSDAQRTDIIVKLKKTISDSEAQSVLKQVVSKQSSIVSIQPLANKLAKVSGTYVVNVNEDVANKVIQQLKMLDNVEFVEKNQIGSILAADVQYPQQWSLENKEQTGGTEGADIHYLGMAEQLKGKNLPQTIIAVLDTGINYELMDFKGIVDQNNDFDFVNDDDDAMDDHFHGTHVSGIIAALNNNGYSMTGINHYTKILPLKVCDIDGTCTAEDVALAIQYAVEKGAKVINLSLGFDEPSQLIEEQLKNAYEKKVTVVAAAGNEGEEKLSYPASSPYTISVGATDNNDELAEFSNYSKKLDLVAPGVLIPSLTSYGEVELVSGTSMAAPHVSAVAGLIYSIKNNNTSPDQVRELLHMNSTDLGQKGPDPYFGYGRLDAAKVVSAASGDVLAPSVNDIDDNDKIVTGTAKPGLKVFVATGSSIIGQTKVDSKGKFSAAIPLQKAGTILTIYAENEWGVRSKSVTKKVQDKTPPSAPKVNTVTDRDTKVTGTTEASAKVIV